jgi:hypothetical protein
MKAREKWGLLMLKNWDQENFDIIILLEFKEFHIMNCYTLFSGFEIIFCPGGNAIISNRVCNEFYTK